VAWKPHRALDVPVEHVVLFGLSLTVLVATMYLPPYFSLEEKGRELVIARSPPARTRGAGADWIAQRDRLEKLLQLGLRPADSLRSSIAILAPLAGSLLSTLLPSK